MAVAGIVLAAGTSTRMGRNKLLLELEGEPLVRRAARRGLAAGLDPLLVVLGHEGDRVREVLHGLAYTPVLNARFAEGMNTSLSAGVAAVPARAEAALVLLADMPFVEQAMIEEVVRRWRETGAPVVVSRYGAAVAPPTLYARALFPLLGGGTGEGRGREVVREQGERAHFVDWPAAALADLDLTEDVARARMSMERGA
ncbi:MAG TPA: NTP transferase domain-containing protein [Anaeromyxobacter sp.]|nr:NTP transferase domain-containing protein [Anaeromyxobacter sp.]